MSELIQKNDNRATVRRKLLTGVSAIALTAYVSAGAVRAEDNDQPLLWIELGGQLDRVSGDPQILRPPFFAQATPAVLAPLIDVQQPNHYSIGENASISFQPKDSDWIISAAVRYGRSTASAHRHYQSQHADVPFTYQGKYLGFTRFRHVFGDATGSSKESHLIVDFKAGKDVGLGLFGTHGSSVLSAGVRFVNFTSSSDTTLLAQPLYHVGQFFTGSGAYSFHEGYIQTNTAVIQSRRDTHGVGPAISWDASAPFAGNSSDGEFTLDWGLNAAVLFGKQRTHVHHQTKGYNATIFLTYPKYKRIYTNSPPDRNSTRSVTIPNVGGFAAVSLKFPNAKVSLGYRADLFFGAMDGGIDTRKSENVGFYGPFASISVGLGG